MRVTTDDGVGLATIVAGPAEAPGLLLVHGIGGAKEDFADHLDALCPATTGSSRSTTGDTARATPPTTRRLLTRPARGRHARGGRRHRPARPAAARALHGRHGDAPAVLAEPIALRRPGVHGHVGRPAARPRSRARRPRGRGRAYGGPRGAQAAVRRARPAGIGRLPAGAGGASGVPRVRRVQVVGAVAGDVGDDGAARSSTSPTSWPTWRRSARAGARHRRRRRTPCSSGRCATSSTTVPGAELVVVPDAGHSPQFENPPAWRDAIALVSRAGPALSGRRRGALSRRRPSP